MEFHSPTKKRRFGPMTQTGRRTTLANRPMKPHNHSMAIIVIFILGVANFALHRAVMESHHPLVGQISWFTTTGGRKIALGLEFAILLAAMLLAGNGWPGIAWGYAIYSVLNAGSGWLILTGRV